MHETLSSEFIGYIDRVVTDLDRTRVRGWAVCLSEAAEWDLAAAGESFSPTQERPDVAAWYKTSEPRYARCGFEVSIPYPGPSLTLSARWAGRETDLFVLDVPAPPPLARLGMSPLRAPQVLVVDNFYEEPDVVRDFALKQDFGEDKNYFRGQRSIHRFLFPGLKERFETLLNARIKRWEEMAVNGVFQYCTSQDALVYHADTQNYAGALYLTPNAPPSSGTSLYRSRAYPDVRRFPQEGSSYEQIFPTGHFDRTKFELVDLIGNVYNRLVLWDAKLLHSASEYFGDRPDNSRLFHLFFFDVCQLTTCVDYRQKMTQLDTRTSACQYQLRLRFPTLSSVGTLIILHTRWEVTRETRFANPRRQKTAPQCMWFMLNNEYEINRGLTMPISADAFDYWVGTMVSLLQPATVCDIGPGAGKYGKLVRKKASEEGFATHITAIEIDQSYVQEYDLRNIYDSVVIDDAINLVRTPRVRFDLVLIGDCIEHMRKSAGVDLLNFLVYRSGYICVIVPEMAVQDDWQGHASESASFNLGRD